MGTKLGNLHIRNATVEEVAPLLPGAIVGQWSEGFVSAYSEEYQWGSAEQAGRKLSRKLPHATVLTAAIFDSDVVSFEVYQAGKRLTAHLLNPYEDINRPGNPKVFCEALGLPPEDEKRLRTLWKKGDAEEQLELTGVLLGLPLYHDPAYMPKESVRRDVAAVDAWIAERPKPLKPPKIKNVTTAICLQEFSGVYMQFVQRVDDVLQLSLRSVSPGNHGYPDHDSEEQFWQTAPDGSLVPILNITGIPFTPTPHIEQGWSFEFRRDSETKDAVDLRGVGCLSHVTADGQQITSPDLCSCQLWEWSPNRAEMSLSPDGKRVLCVCNKHGIWVLDGNDLSVISARPGQEALYGCCVDAYNRFWVKKTNGIDGYDENLRLISHHRIPGDGADLYLNQKGELCILAIKHKTSTLRVYRIS